LTTYHLRKLFREEAAKRTAEREELIEARTMDHKLFYRLINKQRGKLYRCIDELNVDGTVYKSDNILEAWRKHFAELATESDPNKYDQDYLHTMDLKYQHIINICLNEYTHEPVSADELDKAIDKLNRNKSGDISGITVECIIYGGKKFRKLILQTVNASFEHCHVSDILKIGA